MRHRSAIAIAALVAMVLGGCAGLASNNAVRDGLRVGAPQGVVPRVVPLGPVPSADAPATVLGFIQAGAASDGDYDVARQFLAPRVATQWQPDSDIVVYDAGAPLRSVEQSATTVRVSGIALALIDDKGRYTPLPPGTRRETTFTVERTDRWQIAGLDTDFGRWISSRDLSRLFTRHAVHYVSTGERSLVKDMRWFPDDHLPTRLAIAQLEPVPSYLTGAVRNVIPLGTTLATNAVVVKGSVANVDLSTTELQSDPTARANIWAELVATLTQAPEVESVSVTVGGKSLELSGLPATIGSLDELGFPRPAVREPAEVLVRKGSQIEALDRVIVVGPDEPPSTGSSQQDYPEIDPSWRWLAGSLGGHELAAVKDSGEVLARWRDKARHEVPFFAERLGRPSYDRHDVLWIGGVTEADSSARLWAINSAVSPTDTNRSTPRPVRVPWLTDRIVTSSRVSPDGVRIAVVSTDAEGGSPRLDIAAIMREPNGLPMQLTMPQRGAPTLNGIVDAVWLDENTFVVLAAGASSGATQPFVAVLGGEIRALPSVPDNAVAVTTTGGERDLVVTTDKQAIYLRAGTQWIPIKGGGSDFVVGAT